jgi:hypothetical protein
VIWGGLGREPCGTCSPDDIGYTRSLGDGNCGGSSRQGLPCQVLDATD